MPNEQKERASGVAKFGAVTSVIAILISVFTFAYTYLRPADVSVRVGDALFISYGHEGNAGIIMPLVYSNDGAISGVVDGLKLHCGPVGDTNAFDLYSIYYAKIQNGFSDMDSFVVPEIVDGGKETNRLVLFWSEVDWNKTHDFVVGDYKCDVFANVNGSRQGKVAQFSFAVRKSDIDHIKSKPPAQANRFIFTKESGVNGVVIRDPF